MSRKKEAHPSGRTLGIVGEGVGTAGPHAGSGRCRRLTRFVFLNLCCSTTRQWTQEGFSYRQQVKSSVGQKRVLWDVFGFMPCFYMDLRMAESTSAFWGGLVGFFFSFPLLLNGCLVSHLLYKTFMPLQKCSFSCVGLVSWHISWWFVKSQNHRMGKVVRDHTGSSDPTFLHQTNLHQ